MLVKGANFISREPGHLSSFAPLLYRHLQMPCLL